MKDTDFEFMAGLATICFMGGFLLGVLITAIITSKSFKNNKKQF
ncbi:hypothetical protein [Chryseobacterium sp. 52]|nr:hypothetical protein [Chryseobacterium sp. 52]